MGPAPAPNTCEESPRFVASRPAERQAGQHGTRPRARSSGVGFTDLDRARAMPRSARAIGRENELGRPLASAYIRDSTHRTREPSRIVMSAARRRVLARLAPALLLPA